jgi:hypothetical protein
LRIRFSHGKPNFILTSQIFGKWPLKAIFPRIVCQSIALIS